MTPHDLGVSHGEQGCAYDGELVYPRGGIGH